MAFREPQLPPHFRGRESEIDAVLAILKRGNICGLFGMSGSGKTMIAAAVARKMRETHTVVWLNASETTREASVLESLAQAVGTSLRYIPDPVQQTSYLRARIAGRQLLLVFDDVNSVNLSQLLACISEGNAVVVTGLDPSIEAMSAYSVEVMFVPPLSTINATEVLFALVKPDTEPRKLTRVWREIAEAVGNLPIALEIVGGLLRSRINKDPRKFLRTHIKTEKWLGDGQASTRLQGIISRSLALLPDSYRTSASRLCLFGVGWFSSEAISYVCGIQEGDKADEFLELLRLQLILQFDEETGLYLCHSIVRKCLTRVFEAEHPTDIARLRARLKYVDYYQRILRQYGGYEWNLSRYSGLIPHEHQIYRVLDILLSDWNMSRHLTIAVSYCTTIALFSWYLYWRGYWDERIGLLDRSIALMRELSLLKISPFNQMGGNLLVDLGWLYLYRAKYDQAMECATQGKALLASSSDHVFAVELSAQIALATGKHQAARHGFNHLKTAARKYTRNWFVFSYRYADSLEAAGLEQEAEEVLFELQRSFSQVILFGPQIIGDIQAQILFRLAKRYKAMGQLESSMTLLEQAGQLFQQSGVVIHERIAALLLQASLSDDLSPTQSRTTLLITARELAETIGDQATVEQIDHTLAGIASPV